MTQKFRFKGKAEIIHLNARKEGPDDEKELAVDVKLRAVTGGDMLKYFDEELALVFYTDIGAIRNAMIGPVPFRHEIKSYTMTALGNTHFGVTLKKFSLEPLDRFKLELVFQASLKPMGNQVAVMAEYLQDEIDVTIEPENAELQLDNPQPEQAIG